MQDLEKILEKLSSVHVLSVGDVMIDRFLQGKVERISPEAPVPIFQFVQERKMLGGAGNVVANLNALGCQTSFVSIVGDDDLGKGVASLLKKLNADYFLLKLSDRPTIMKARFIAGNNHILRFDKEKILPLTQEQEQEILNQIKQKMPSCDIVLISDYAKGLLSSSLTQDIISLAKKESKMVLVDPKGQDYSKYKGAFLIKPNRKELEQVSGQSLDISSEDFLSEISETARYVLKKYDIENMVVTLGEKGMFYISSNPSVKEIYLPTAAREVFDVSGAGDTSLSMLGLALACDASIEQSMILANLAAGVVVGKVGTATVKVSEIEQMLRAVSE